MVVRGKVPQAKALKDLVILLNVCMVMSVRQELKNVQQF